MTSSAALAKCRHRQPVWITFRFFVRSRRNSPAHVSTQINRLFHGASPPHGVRLMTIAPLVQSLDSQGPRTYGGGAAPCADLRFDCWCSGAAPTCARHVCHQVALLTPDQVLVHRCQLCNPGAAVVQARVGVQQGCSARIKTASPCSHLFTLAEPAANKSTPPCSHLFTLAEPAANKSTPPSSNGTYSCSRTYLVS